MSAPVELLPLAPKLKELFEGRVPPGKTGSLEQREKDFLSRALAAYALHKLAGAALDAASEAIVDGGGDGGIDAIYFEPSSRTLWVVQSKFVSDGRGEPSLGDVTKFKAGVDNLLNGRLDAFEDNAAWRALFARLNNWFEEGSLRVRGVLVYSGLALVSPDRGRLFDDSIGRFSADDDFLEFVTCNLTTIHDWLTDADASRGVESISLVIGSPGKVAEPYETIFGTLTLADVAAMQREFGHKLVASNIRSFKGRTDVNQEIVSTARTEADRFFYLNNGLTAFCSRLEIDGRDRGNPAQKRIRAYGFSIVNGAQTLGSVAKAMAKPEKDFKDGRVFIRIISLEKCEDEREFADRITRATNLQNEVAVRDFAAQYAQHDIIARQLSPLGVHYHYKVGADSPAGDGENFDFTEATSACACLEQDKSCDFIARLLANRDSVISRDMVYPKEEPLRSRLERVFPPNLSGRTVWRAVQAQRIVLQIMRDGARASVGVRKAFLENARWLVLNAIYLKFDVLNGDLALTAGEAAAVSQMADRYSEDLFRVCEEAGYVSRREDLAGGAEPYEAPRHFRSVFCSATDCQTLRGALLAKLAASPAPPINADMNLQ